MKNNGIQIKYYSVSKDEHINIEDMANEHLVNVLYKLIKDENYRANFALSFEDGTSDTGELSFSYFRKGR